MLQCIVTDMENLLDSHEGFKDFKYTWITVSKYFCFHNCCPWFALKYSLVKKQCQSFFQRYDYLSKLDKSLC